MWHNSAGMNRSGSGGRSLRGAVLLLFPGLALAWTPVDHETTGGDAAAGPLAEQAAPASYAGEREEISLVLATGTRVWVEGTSTVRDYSCEAEQVEGRVELGSSAARVADLPGQVNGMVVTVPVNTLECGNDTMNRHMLEALKANEHRTIRFSMTRSEVVAEAGAGTAMLEGSLRIAGQERPVLLFGQVAESDDGSLVVTGSYELDMTAFGIRPPRLMLGTLRVHDDVVVHYELVLRQ